MPPLTPDPDDRITPWLVKRVVFPFLATTAMVLSLEVSVKDWKCERTAKRLGYLEGRYIPPNRVGTGEACICQKKMRPDGSIDSSARSVIDLEHQKLSW